MTSPSNFGDRQALEVIFQKSPNVSVFYLFRRWFQQIGQAIAQEVTRDPNALRISRFTDIYGQSIWHVYDPVTHPRFLTRSEKELRIWIDGRR
ncbi:MAG: hypothetical protein VKL39_05575 [Leptolyngbyaceae bacterium]|nr:hypothetical protein [Leptolyngbyaceae bacterium]